MTGTVNAVLCIGLRSKHRNLQTIAPRILTVSGEVLMAERLPPAGERLTTLGQRITYLSQVLERGLYDCEVVRAPATPSAPTEVGAEVPIVAPSAMAAERVPEWARVTIDRKGWVAP